MVERVLAVMLTKVKEALAEPVFADSLVLIELCRLLENPESAVRNGRPCFSEHVG